MKNNISYYQHYANSDEHPKFKMLRVKYGWAGEGKFWAINNRIAQADNCELELEKKYNKASLATDLNFTLEELEEFLEYLHKECDLIIRQNGHVTTNIVQENLKIVMKDRKRCKIQYEKRKIQDVTEMSSSINSDESKINSDENIQTKLKETKLKETKLKETKLKETKLKETKLKETKLKKEKINKKEILDSDESAGVDEKISDIEKKRKLLKLSKATKLFPEQYKENDFKEIVYRAVEWLQYYKDEPCVSAPQSREALFNTHRAQSQIDIYYRNIYKHPDATFNDVYKSVKYWEWLLKERSDSAGSDWKYRMQGRWIKFKFIMQSKIKDNTIWDIAQEWVNPNQRR